MFDLREHKDLIRRLVSEANQNDPNWEWSVRRLSKNVACIFWGYLEYCNEAELSFQSSSAKPMADAGLRLVTSTVGYLKVRL